MLFKKILLPLDGSDIATQALPHAEEIALGSGAELVLFEVIERPSPMMASRVATLPAGNMNNASPAILAVLEVTTDDALCRLGVDRAKESLGQLAESLHHRKVQATTDVDIGEPASRIVDYAVANHIDLIVMSSHGRTGLSRWAYGSVANKVLQTAPCPVMVVRSVQSDYHLKKDR